MDSAGLLREMGAATASVRQIHLDRLRSLGVGLDTIAKMGAEFYPFGIVKAAPCGQGLYQPGEGVSHIVLPVVHDGALVDLCAFRSTNPDEWRLRTGNGWALGLEEGVGRWVWNSPGDPGASPPKHPVGCPPHIFGSPLDWLRGDCSGICVLDWRSPEIYQLDVLESVTVSDQATAKLLTTALTRPSRVPNIEVMGVLAHVA